MKRLWQSLAQRIGKSVRQMNDGRIDVGGDLDALRRDHTRNDGRFWGHVEWHLKMQRRIGRWEGADTAKAILKPHVRTEVK